MGRGGVLSRIPPQAVLGLGLIVLGLTIAATGAPIGSVLLAVSVLAVLVAAAVTS